jgi:hypothetical protein
MTRIKLRKLFERPQARLVEGSPDEGRARTLRVRVDRMVCDI